MRQNAVTSTGYSPCFLFVLSFRYFGTVESAMTTDELILIQMAGVGTLYGRTAAVGNRNKWKHKIEALNS